MCRRRHRKQQQLHSELETADSVNDALGALARVPVTAAHSSNTADTLQGHSSGTQQQVVSGTTRDTSTGVQPGCFPQSLQNVWVKHLKINTENSELFYVRCLNVYYIKHI